MTHRISEMKPPVLSTYSPTRPRVHEILNYQAECGVSSTLGEQARLCVPNKFYYI